MNSGLEIFESNQHWASEMRERKHCIENLHIDLEVGD